LYTNVHAALNRQAVGLPLPDLAGVSCSFLLPIHREKRTDSDRALPVGISIPRGVLLRRADFAHSLVATFFKSISQPLERVVDGHRAAFDPWQKSLSQLLQRRIGVSLHPLIELGQKLAFEGSPAMSSPQRATQPIASIALEPSLKSP
jgi:hypothetical protein